MTQNKLLIIITRMSGAKGKNSDEFVQIWQQKENNSGAKLFELDSNDVLVIHAYAGKYSRFNKAFDFKEIADKIYKDVIDQAARNKKDLKKYDEIGLIYHPHIADDGLIVEHLKPCFDKLPISFIKRYSSGGEGEYDAIKKLATYINEGNENILEHYQSIWNLFSPNQELEIKIEFLHDLISIAKVENLDQIKRKYKGLDLDSNKFWREIERNKKSIANNFFENTKYIRIFESLRDSLFIGAKL